MKMIQLRHTMLYGMGIRVACAEVLTDPLFVSFEVDNVESMVTEGMYRNVAEIVEREVENEEDIG